jgi:hypothetical protein
MSFIILNWQFRKFTILEYPTGHGSSKEEHFCDNVNTIKIYAACCMYELLWLVRASSSNVYHTCISIIIFIIITRLFNAYEMGRKLEFKHHCAHRQLSAETCPFLKRHSLSQSFRAWESLRDAMPKSSQNKLRLRCNATFISLSLEINSSRLSFMTANF